MSDKYIRILILVCLIIAYCKMLALAYEPIDPCSASPIEDDRIGNFLLIIYPLLFGGISLFLFIIPPFKIQDFIRLILFAIFSLIPVYMGIYAADVLCRSIDNQLLIELKCVYGGYVTVPADLTYGISIFIFLYPTLFLLIRYISRK